MFTKDQLELACISMLVLFILLSGYFLFAEKYIFSLISLGGIMLSVQARKRLGYRGPRKTMFVLHLACNAVFLISLLILIAGLSSRLSLFAEATFIGTSASGMILVYQSRKNYLPA